jgi:hypothetical protein
MSTVCILGSGGRGVSRWIDPINSDFDASTSIIERTQYDLPTYPASPHLHAIRAIDDSDLLERMNSGRLVETNIR